MEPRLLKDALKKLIETKPLGKSLNHIEVLNRWDEIVSSVVGKHAQPAGIKGDELIISVGSSVWLNELSFLKDEIVKRINETVGREIINDVKFYLKEE